MSVNNKQERNTMPTHIKTITVSFSGITFDDTIGFGEDVNQTYSFKFSLSPKGSWVSTYNGTVNSVNVYVLAIIEEVDGTRIIYNLTPQSDLSNHVHIFDGTSFDSVIQNSLPNGGTATVTLA